MRDCVVACACLLLLVACQKKDNPLFVQIDPSQSGVTFENNTPQQKDALGPLDYLYYYNGGGVAAGDFNNDGLVDLFFVSNQRSNRLYTNEGNFRFRDVTDSAGVAGFAQWKTGVTVADVNGDGLLDIYVCALSNYKGLEGSNELFINMGNNTFQEKAADYGLDFSGFATQSVFFDYDRDGDLDLYLATHAPPNSRAYDRVMASAQTNFNSADKLFRNDNGLFADVTEQSGIGNVAGYSLGVSVADINNDGWDDIYVTNDFYEADQCFINQKNGTFHDEASQFLSYHSRYSHGCDFADLNNDGYPEIMTTDIISPFPMKSNHTEDPWELFVHKKSYDYALQFSRNTLQKNENGKSFSELGAFAGVSATDWSWSVLLADFNNDGKKDIFTSAGIPKRLNDLEFLEFAHKDSLRYSESLSPAQTKRILDAIPDGRASNHIFENQDNFRFADQSQKWGLDKAGYSNGAIYADLDNDGDLDVVTNNFYGPASVFKNQTREQTPDKHFISVHLKGEHANTQGLGAKVFVKTSDGFQFQQATATHGFLSSIQVPLNFGVGTTTSIDSLIVVWHDGKTQVLTSVKTDQQITLNQSEARNESIEVSLFQQQDPLMKEIPLTIDFKHKENNYFDFYRESLVPFLTSREGPALAVGDVNADGLEDFYVGGAKHQSGVIYLQKQNDSFVALPQQSFDDSVFEDVDAAFADIDGDHDLDLYVASGGSEFYDKMLQQTDRIYVNDGKGNFTRDVDALPLLLQNKSCVRPADIDGDGDIDFFAGGRVVPFQYGKPAASFMLVNDGHGKFTDETKRINASFSSLGMVTDAQWGDIDGDKDLDLIVVGEWMPIRIFLNEKSVLTEINNIISNSSSIKNITGMWQCVSLGDFDKDGDLDIVAGNLGLNSVLKSKDTTALRLMVGVQINDGKKTPLMSRLDNNGKYYPVPGWQTLNKGMPDRFAKAYPTAAKYNGADIEQLTNALKLEWDAELNVNQLASLWFENKNGKEFVARMLPDEFQYSSVYAIDVTNLNADEYPDLVAGGNTLNASPDQGAYMGSLGVVVVGDKKSFFKTKATNQSGFEITGEVRNIRPIKVNGKSAWLFARNNDSLKLFQSQTQTAYVKK